ncbi:MAG: hypothetical protein M1829_006476 [Trizodia sp. TS-e1964]|nr:MAG: hypothetical protein M1829_006476 [Trizodia sp. TS-e1964]
MSLGLCRRRRWLDPMYESYRTSSGYCCTVRVNHREYQTDTVYESEALARESAAMRAYLICRNFSVSDGMYPGGHKNGVVQGLPVNQPGTARRSVYNDAYAGYNAAANTESSGLSSGGSSPGSSSASLDSGRDQRGNRRRESDLDIDMARSYRV